MDVEGSDAKEMLEAHKKTTESAPQGSGAGGVAALFETIKSLCDKELVNTVNGVFEFHLTGSEPGVWYLDLKNDAGKEQFSNILSNVITGVSVTVFINLFTSMV